MLTRSGMWTWSLQRFNTTSLSTHVRMPTSVFYLLRKQSMLMITLQTPSCQHHLIHHGNEDRSGTSTKCLSINPWVRSLYNTSYIYVYECEWCLFMQNHILHYISALPYDFIQNNSENIQETRISKLCNPVLQWQTNTGWGSLID